MHWASQPIHPRGANREAILNFIILSCKIKLKKLFHHFSSLSRTVSITFVPGGLALYLGQSVFFSEIVKKRNHCPIQIFPQEVSRNILISIKAMFIVTSQNIFDCGFMLDVFQCFVCLKVVIKGGTSTSGQNLFF